MPLRPTDEDVELDLQASVDRAYRVGRHYVDIDYAADLSAPLRQSDARAGLTSCCARRASDQRAANPAATAGGATVTQAD